MTTQDAVQIRLARETAEHTKRQANANEQAVEEARRAIDVAQLSLRVSAVTAIVGVLAVIGTFAAPYLAQLNADSSTTNAQHAIMSSEIDDIEINVAAIATASELLGAPIDGETFDSDAQNELFRGSTQFEYLHPIEFARFEISKAVSQYNADVDFINAQKPEDLKVNEGMGPIGAKRRSPSIETPLVPVERRRAVAFWIAQEMLSGSIGRQVAAINAEALKWSLSGRRCLSPQGYPYKTDGAVIRVACNSLDKISNTSKRPSNRDLMWVIHTWTGPGGERVVARAQGKDEARLR